MTNHQPHVTTQTVKLEPELLMRLKIHAAKTCMKQQDILRTALMEYLDKHLINDPSTSRGGTKKT